MPKVIEVKKEFGTYMLNRKPIVDELVEKISSGDSVDLVVSLIDCVIDYPATSRIIDKICQELSNKAGTKKLEIHINLVLSKEVVLNFLFNGSEFFGLKAEKVATSDIEQKVKTKLGQVGISLKVKAENADGTVEEMTL